MAFKTQPQGGTVYYDPSIGYYYRESVPAWEAKNTPNLISELNDNRSNFLGGPKYLYYKPVPISGFGQSGQTTYTPPTVDFNNLPNQISAGMQIYGAGAAATPYQRPTAPTQPQGTGYRPQFDPTFIQQMLAQRFGNNQGTGIPTATRPAGPPTLTPGTRDYYPTNQSTQGGLGALRAIANSASSGGTTNAPV